MAGANRRAAALKAWVTRRGGKGVAARAGVRAAKRAWLVRSHPSPKGAAGVKAAFTKKFAAARPLGFGAMRAAVKAAHAAGVFGAGSRSRQFGRSSKMPAFVSSRQRVAAGKAWEKRRG